MSRSTLVVLVFLALLAVAAGLYASGPKYVIGTHAQSSFARIYCQNGYEQKRRQITSHGRSGVVYSNGITCKDRSDGWHWVSGSGPSERTIRRAAAWERVWFAIVGSKDTRG